MWCGGVWCEEVGVGRWVWGDSCGCDVGGCGDGCRLWNM